MTLEPIFAENILEGYESGSHQPACRVSAHPVESEAPVVEEHSPEDGLGEIVGEAHFSVWGDFHKEVLCLRLIEKKDDTRDDDEHHSEILPHIQ